MTSSMAAPAQESDLRPPSLLTGGAVLVVCAYGLLLLVPVLAAMMMVSLLSLGIWTILIPASAIALATYFLPFGFGNAHITRLVRSLQPGGKSGLPRFVVQLTFNPRLRTGLRALLEDADDIGWLSITDSGVEFHGDSIRFTIPRASIRTVRVQSIGLRGLFVYPRVVLAVTGIGGVSDLRLADRSSWVLPTARKRTAQLHRSLTEARSSPGPSGNSPKI
jgi:hypothetical protein